MMKKICIISFILTTLVIKTIFADEEYIYFNDVEHPASLDTIKQSIIVKDETDVLTSDNLTIVSDSYSTHMNDLGDYTITFNVSDQSGNQNTFSIMIRNVDINPPVITVSQNSITLPIEGNILEYLPTFSCQDTYAGDLTSTVDILGLSQKQEPSQIMLSCSDQYNTTTISIALHYKSQTNYLYYIIPIAIIGLIGIIIKVSIKSNIDKKN